MQKLQKFLAPLYGVKKETAEEIKLNDSLVIRNFNLFEREDKLFKKHGLLGSYTAVMGIDYQYDENDPSEPYPGIVINLTNKIDAALLVYGDGVAGIAGIISVPETGGYPGTTLSSLRPRFEEYLDKEMNADFIPYYAKFVIAYEMRPVAFDVFVRMRERFANNDKTLDSCIVLESIFVPRGEKSKKPFILNGMKIMGFDTDAVERIDSLIDYRNAIMHADREKQHQLLSGARFTHVWFEDTLKIVRKILFQYVESPWK